MIPIASPAIESEVKQQLAEVVDSGIISQGPKVKEFEEKYAQYTGVKHAIAVNSGTAALHTALLAHGIGAQDEVITTPFSFIASANSILYCNAKPVFADIQADTYNIDPEKIAEKITPKTKAVLAVHLYGHPFDVKPVKELCEDHKLTLIEDACQAHGAQYDGKKCGSFATGCFSFYPTKNMTTSEGGMITTDDAQVAEKCRIIRNHGSSEKYVHETLGYNYRMTDLCAVIGLSQLKRLDEANQKRRINAKSYDRMLDSSKYTLPLEKPGCTHVYHQYTIQCREREKTIEKLRQNDIGYGVHYPIPIHRQPYYKKLGFNDSLPVAENAAKEVLSIPVHPKLEREEIDFISEVLNGL
ncbi:MAG TPA: DegT/DnrJ/EryC1/StrS family aminotransferase [Candidatus Altiarchaeales archaeon]|nr:DegT/DnrJ/EryC1/StrS family aminotransferase [Candidatus Altiarchaeales archaeon]